MKRHWFDTTRYWFSTTNNRGLQICYKKTTVNENWYYTLSLHDCHWHATMEHYMICYNKTLIYNHKILICYKKLYWNTTTRLWFATRCWFAINQYWFATKRSMICGNMTLIFVNIENYTLICYEKTVIFQTDKSAQNKLYLKYYGHKCIS